MSQNDSEQLPEPVEPRRVRRPGTEAADWLTAYEKRLVAASMAVERAHSSDDLRASTWDDLGAGVPSVAAFARLCSLAMCGDSAGPEVALSREAQTLLFAARHRGVLQIKASNAGFEAPERFLAVTVETLPGVALVFRRRDNPEMTVRFLDGFRELCSAGLVMHHLYRDFSLTRKGFEAARQLQEDPLRESLQFAEEELG